LTEDTIIHGKHGLNAKAIENLVKPWLITCGTTILKYYFDEILSCIVMFEQLKSLK